MKKAIIFSGVIFLSVMIIGGCKKKEEPDPDPTPTDLSGDWEGTISLDASYKQDLTFYLTLEQSGSTISGDIVFVDSTDISGTVAGSISGTAITFISSINAPGYSNTFTGVLSENTSTSQTINGTLTFSSKGPSAGTTAFVSISRIFYTTKCKDHAPDPNNQYLFFADSSSKQVTNPTGRPVIFVHGMDGRYQNWNDMLDTLDAAFFQRHKVYRFQYNWKDSIMINGRILKHCVDTANLVDPILVAHSMGGLVSRAYIVSGGKIDKLVTLGTPHLGTPIVYFLETFAGLQSSLCALDTVGPRDMAPYGKFITGLLTDPLDLLNRSKYYCLDGEMGKTFDSTTSKWSWNEPWYNPTDIVGYNVFVTVYKIPLNDGMVPDYSSLFQDGGVNRPLPIQYWVDHFNLVKPYCAPNITNYINGL